jgi:hypothetical protein
MKLNRQITNIRGVLAISLVCVACGLMSGGDLNRPIEPDFWRFTILVKAGMLLIGLGLFVWACLRLFRYVQSSRK